MKELTLEYKDPRELSNEYFRCSTWCGTKLILPFNMFKEMQKHNQSFEDLKQFLENYISLRLTFCGSCSNSNTYIEYNNELFVLGVYVDGLYFWDKQGNISLGIIKIDYETIPTDNFITDIKQILDNYIDNKINCSDCGKLIDMNDIGGQYFAGRYCKECWNGKWKEIESKETYD